MDEFLKVIPRAIAVIIVSPPTAEEAALTGTVMAPGLGRLTPAQMGDVIGTAHVTLASLAAKEQGAEEVNRG